MVNKIRLYWPLIKSLQTGLLLATGIAGYLSSRPPFDISLLLGLAATLFLAISGSTIMNMWYDRDIDAWGQTREEWRSGAALHCRGREAPRRA